MRGLPTAPMGRSGEARDNAILFPHMYSGTPCSLDRVDRRRAAPSIPDRWFVICPGQFGNGVSSSPSNTTRRVPGADDRRRCRRPAPIAGGAPRGRAARARARLLDGRPAGVRMGGLLPGGGAAPGRLCRTRPHDGGERPAGGRIRGSTADRRHEATCPLLGGHRVVDGALSGGGVARRGFRVARRPRHAPLRGGLRPLRDGRPPLPARQVAPVPTFHAMRAATSAQPWGASPREPSSRRSRMTAGSRSPTASSSSASFPAASSASSRASGATTPGA